MLYPPYEPKPAMTRYQLNLLIPKCSPVINLQPTPISNQSKTISVLKSFAKTVFLVAVFYNVP